MLEIKFKQLLRFILNLFRVVTDIYFAVYLNLYNIA